MDLLKLELDSLVDDIGEQDPNLGLLASEVWEALRDIANQLRARKIQE